MKDSVQNAFVLHSNGEKYVPLSPLSIGENRRSLAVVVVELLNLYPPLSNSGVDIRLKENNYLFTVMSKSYLKWTTVIKCTEASCEFIMHEKSDEFELLQVTKENLLSSIQIFLLL